MWFYTWLMYKYSLLLFVTISLFAVSCTGRDTEYLEKIKKIDKTEAKQGQSELSKSSFEQGKLYYTEKNYEKARESYYSAIENNPTWWEPYYRLALVSIQTDNYENAVQYISFSLLFEHPDAYNEIIQKDTNLDPLRNSRYGDRLKDVIEKGIAIDKLDNYIIETKTPLFRNRIDTVDFFILSGKDRTKNIEALKNLKYLENIKRLDCADSGLLDEDLKYIGKIEGLHILSLNSNKLNGSGLKYLANLKSLSTIDLSNNNIDDSNLKYLADNRSLSGIYLKNTKFSNHGLKYLTKTHIYELDISRSIIDNHDIEYINKFHDLRILNLSFTNITDEGFCLLKLNNIERLYLMDTKIGDKSIECIMRMKNIKTLYLNGTRLRSGRVLQLAKLPSLANLSISDTELSKETLKSFMEIRPDLFKKK